MAITAKLSKFDPSGDGSCGQNVQGKVATETSGRRFYLKSLSMKMSLSEDVGWGKVAFRFILPLNVLKLLKEKFFLNLVKLWVSEVTSL